MESQPPVDGAPASGGTAPDPRRGPWQSPSVAAVVPSGYGPFAVTTAEPPDTGGRLAVSGLISGIISLVLPVLSVGFLLSRAPHLGELLILASVLVGIIGVLLSALGLGARWRRRSALAGLILSIVGLVFSLALLVLALSLLGSLRIHSPLPLRRRFP